MNEHQDLVTHHNFIELMKFIETELDNKSENEHFKSELFTLWCGGVRYMNKVEKTDPYIFLLLGECLDIIAEVFSNKSHMLPWFFLEGIWDQALSLYIEILSYLTHNKEH